MKQGKKLRYSRSWRTGGRAIATVTPRQASPSPSVVPCDMPPAPRHERTPVLRWAVLAPFITPDESRWLAPFVDPSRHRLEAVQPGHGYVSWHAKAKGVTGLAEWVHYQRYAGRAWAAQPDGIITVFPQLAIAAGLRKR